MPSGPRNAGDADFIAFARPFIREPGFPRSLPAGRQGAVDACHAVVSLKKAILTRLESEGEVGILRPMSKSPRVTFKYKRIVEDEWQIEAHYPGAEIRYIKGFTSKAEIDEWLQGSRRIDWLRSQGYAK